VFDLRSNERLNYWKRFRDNLEISLNPLQDVMELWLKAPFVSPYLEPFDPNSWPDPWHLILDGKYDDLAICLGMLYTLKLTQRFYSVDCEIHMSIDKEKKDPCFFLVVDHLHVLNYNYGKISKIEDLSTIPTNTLWSVKVLQ
jgi:hypothetical protein